MRVGETLRVSLLGPSQYPDKRRGVVDVVTELNADAHRLHPGVRLQFLLAPQSSELLLALISSPAWPMVLHAAGPGQIELVQGEDLAEADLMIMFWDGRQRRPTLLKLAHDFAAGGTVTRCYAWTGLRTVGPIPLPTIPTDWSGV